MAPKAFISHAMEDKERFVLGFAIALRKRGVDAWLDRWEMLPGDSLVDKIFEEGIKNADAFIIVLSSTSVTKKWVREELNVALVNRISRSSKIIPVIIDDCDVPECLRSTVWERIRDLSCYEDELSRIVNAIFEYVEKPPVGPPPAHTQTLLDSFPELNRIDAIVLAKACAKSMKANSPAVEYSSIRGDIIGQGISEEELRESLEVLDSRGYINTTKTIGGAIPIFRICLSAFDEYLRSQVDDYSLIVQDVSLRIVNENQMVNSEIANSAGYPVRVVSHVFEMLESRGLVKLAKSVGGTAFVVQVSAELKRQLRDI